MDYPLFIPPEKFFDKKNFDWSIKEAIEYFKWFMSIKEQRLEDFLDFLAVDRYDVGALGDKMFDLFSESEFSAVTEDEELDLTSAGFALAADVSLFISDYILWKYNGKVHWEIVKKPKSAISYHLPALFGFCKMPYIECMRGLFYGGRVIGIFGKK